MVVRILIKAPFRGYRSSNMFVLMRVINESEIFTGSDGAVPMSSANGMAGVWVRISVPVPIQSWYLKTQWGMCGATTPSSLSLTSNRVTTN